MGSHYPFDFYVSEAPFAHSEDPFSSDDNPLSIGKIEVLHTIGNPIFASQLLAFEAEGLTAVDSYSDGFVALWLGFEKRSRVGQKGGESESNSETYIAERAVGWPENALGEMQRYWDIVADLSLPDAVRLLNTNLESKRSTITVLGLPIPYVFFFVLAQIIILAQSIFLLLILGAAFERQKQRGFGGIPVIWMGFVKNKWISFSYVIISLAIPVAAILSLLLFPVRRTYVEFLCVFITLSAYTIISWRVFFTFLGFRAAVLKRSTAATP